MATNVTWPVINGTTYSVPASGEVNWASLSNYLIALGTAQNTTTQVVATRVALTTPVTVASATDCLVECKLSTPAAVAVTLPAGVAGQVFIIKDGTGDAVTNVITITPNGAETIDGAASYVLSANYAAVMLVFRGTNWDVVVETRSAFGQFVWGKTTGLGTGAGAFQRTFGSLRNLTAQGGTGCFFSTNSTNLAVRHYYDGSGAAKATSTSSGYTRLSLTPTTIQFLGNTDAQTADAALVTTNEVNILSGTTAGVVTIGPAASTATNLAVNGAMSTNAIVFPATQVSAAGVNTLDDYEEGTFTPTLAYATPGTSSFTYSAQVGTYTKVGNLVRVQIRILLSAFSKGTASGALSVNGLPFTSQNTSSFNTPFAVALDTWTFAGTVAAINASNTTTILLQTFASGGALTTIGDPSATSSVVLSATYQTAT